MSGYNAEHSRRYRESDKGRESYRRNSAAHRERHRDEINRKRREKAALEREERTPKVAATPEQKMALHAVTKTIAERATKPKPPKPATLVAIEPPARRPAAVVKGEFDYFLNEASVNGWQPNCYKEPDEFTDFDPKHPPTADEAEMLCWRCPLLEICDEYARTVKPEIGIHGGRVWVNKRLVSGRKRRRVMEPVPALPAAA